jgi:hypothetical protein
LRRKSARRIGGCRRRWFPSPGHTNRDRPLRDIVDREHVIVTGQVDVRTRISVDAFIAEVHAANAPADDQILFDAAVVERVRFARIKRDNVKVLQFTPAGNCWRSLAMTGMIIPSHV